MQPRRRFAGGFFARHRIVTKMLGISAIRGMLHCGNRRNPPFSEKWQES
jgi:hypothetical protein